MFLLLYFCICILFLSMSDSQLLLSSSLQLETALACLCSFQLDVCVCVFLPFKSDALVYLDLEDTHKNRISSGCEQQFGALLKAAWKLFDI